MHEEIIAVLQNAPGVTQYVGERINWGAHPQGAPLPGLVLTLVGGTSTYHLDGPDSIARERFQVDCWATDYPTATLLGREVISRLSGYRSGTVLGVFHASTRDGREGSNQADRPFRVSLDFDVRFHR